jgi:hypothetical protein
MNFNVAEAGGWQTRAGAQVSQATEFAGVYTLRGKEASDSLFMYATISDDMDEAHIGREPEGTRAAPVDNTNFYSSFGVLTSVYQGSWSETTCYPDFMHNVEVTKTSNWTTSYRWPGSGRNIRFFAYAPYNASGVVLSANTTAGTPTITYTVPSAVANQNDLLTVATAGIVGDGSVAAELTFSHALTAVRFVTDDVMAGTISKISLKGVYSKGTHVIGSDTWSSQTTAADFTQTLTTTVDGSSGVEIVPSATTFMMLPQTLPTGATLEVVYTDDATDTERTLSASIATGTWPTGKTVTYNVSLRPAVSDGTSATLAPPGVIGYIRGTRTLTLKGSKEYAANADIKAYAEATFGGLENQTVYTAFFKYGSLVAISSHQSSNVTYEDYVTWPSEWEKTGWGSIPLYNDNGTDYSNGYNASSPLYQDPANAKGDPCQYYFGTGWRLPASYSSSMKAWSAAGTDGLPAAGRFSNVTGETGVFYPAAGDRGAGGGAMYRQGEQGYYWSSATSGSDNAFRLNFSKTGDVSSGGYAQTGRALAVRCVTATAPAGGVLAAPGTIGYIAGTNELTLKGSNEFKDNAAIKKYADDNFGGLSDKTVYAAYFKFGSLVAVSSDPTDSSSPYLESDDIIAAPDEWKGSLAGARNYIGTDWSKVPFYNDNGTDFSNSYAASDSGYQSPSTAKGDPCQYYFGTGWLLPSGNPYNNYQSSDIASWSAVGTNNLPAAGRFSNLAGETGVFYSAAGGRHHSYGAVQMSDGNYWSSTAGDSAGGYRLTFGSSDVDQSSLSYYDNGFSVRCVTPTISVTPTTATFMAVGETKTFTVTTTNFTGTVGVSAIDDATTNTATWITTASVSGTTLTVTTAENSADAARTATVTLTAGTATTTVTVTQSAPTTPLSGILAPPGVIGYIAGTNTLTLRGSKEYAVNTDIANYAKTIDSRGLEEETVYVAFFKFGSLVAISSDPTDTSSPYLDLDDIIAAPSSPYIGIDALKENVAAQTTEGGRWSQIPASPPISLGATIGTDLASGLGDPCDYYFGDGDGDASDAGSTWHLPTAVPYNGDPNYSQDNMLWKDPGAPGLGAGLPPGWLSLRAGEVGWFYPITGYRTIQEYGTDAYDGRVQYQDENAADAVGEFWSSTGAYSSVGGYYFEIKKGAIITTNWTYYGTGMGVRCVRPAPTISVDPTTATFAAEGETQTFTVTTTNFSGTPSVSKVGDSSDASAAWITTASVSGTTLTLTAAENSATNARTATVTLTAGTATATVSITQKGTIWGGENHVLYFDTNDANHPLKVGRWVTSLSDEDTAEGVVQLTEANRSNLAFFKFGSVIGFTSEQYWNNSCIKFNPSNYVVGTDITGFGDNNNELPNIPGYTDADYVNNRNVSAPGYHNAANIQQGKGDPCKLAGIDITRLGESGYLANYDSGWRLPTMEEGRMFIGNGPDEFDERESGSVYYRWSYGTGTFPANTAREEDPILPAAGAQYLENGGAGNRGEFGFYWASTAVGGLGYTMAINSSYVWPSTSYEPTYGFTVRCVRD